MCSPEPIHMNSRGPIAPVGNHCPIRRLLAVGGCFKNLNPLSQRGAFAWPLPSVQVIHYRRAVDADRRVCVCVCVWVLLAHRVSHWKPASWQHLAVPVESLCENFLRPGNQTHCVIVVRVRHYLLQCALTAARWRWMDGSPCSSHFGKQKLFWVCFFSFFLPSFALLVPN